MSRRGKNISTALRHSKKVGRPRKVDPSAALKLWQEGLSMAAIASCLSVSESAVRRAIQRAITDRRKG